MAMDAWTIGVTMAEWSQVIGSIPSHASNYSPWISKINQAPSIRVIVICAETHT